MTDLEKEAIEKSPYDDPREIFGWAMYDWAISAFSATVVTVFFGPYLTSLVKAAADSAGNVYLGPLPIRYDSFYAYVASFSVFLQIFFLPFLGAISDYSNRRKRFMQFLTLIGAVSTFMLFMVTDGRHWLGAGLFTIANLAFGACMVLYNAYLSEIASEKERDRVSAYGWGLGYIGGGILLLINLIVFQFRESLLLETGDAVRLCLASAGLWWLIFGQFSFDRLRRRKAEKALPANENYFSLGLKQIFQTFREIQSLPETLKFLIAYLLYNDGVQTVIVVATVFGSEELKMEAGTLISVILMVQFVAFLGAIFFGKVAERFGTKEAIVITLVIWCGIVVYAWLLLSTPLQFWIMAAVVALVMGGSQALSRSLFSRMIPKGKEAAFFSFYEVSERGTSWIGTFLFGFVNQVLGGLRYGILSLIVLFAFGLCLLFFVNVSKAISRAQIQSGS
ncbi:MAG: MFS transporter [Chloroherpetonaceae bacterium]|nr:MFS transporter [Chloroherpetonaceae bacterium]